MKNLLTLLVVSFAALGCSGSNGSGSGGGGTGAGGSAMTAGSGGSGGGTTTTNAGGSSSDGGATGTGGALPEPTVSMTVEPTTMQAGDQVTAHVSVTNFVLEAPVGQPNQPGHGHYHIYLDDASGGAYLVADQVPTTMLQIPQGTQVGAHTLKVTLGENDHAPLVPAVEDVVPITVVAP